MAQEGSKDQSEEKKYTPEEFAKSFQELCNKMGYQLVATPTWRATNHGSFELVVQWSVGKLSKQASIDNNEV